MKISFFCEFNSSFVFTILWNYCLFLYGCSHTCTWKNLRNCCVSCVVDKHQIFLKLYHRYSANHRRWLYWETLAVVRQQNFSISYEYSQHETIVINSKCCIKDRKNGENDFLTSLEILAAFFSPEAAASCRQFSITKSELKIADKNATEKFMLCKGEK